MNEKQAIKILESLIACGKAHRAIVIGASDIEAMDMAISDMRKMQYLEGRPCEVCACHNEKGCGVWECMFDGKENV